MAKQLSILLLLLSTLLHAQTTIEGLLVDENNNPVPFASLYLPDSKNSTVSNENGKFYLVLTPADKSVIISHLSYQDIQIKVTGNFPARIVLKEKDIELEEIVIGNQLTAQQIALKVAENLEKNHDVDPAHYEYFTRIVYYTPDWNKVNLVQEFYGKLKHTKGHDTRANVDKSRAVIYTKEGEAVQNKENTIGFGR